MLPTLVTLWLLLWTWNFLWESLGKQLIWGLKKLLWSLGMNDAGKFLEDNLRDEYLGTRLVGVIFAVIAVYIVGVFVGNLLGRTMWRVAELAAMRVPLVREIYPAVKQVTDFLLAEKTEAFKASRVVAVQPHEQGIWSIGLVTGAGVKSLSDSIGQDMVTVFVPSSPTAFSGYVLVVPRERLIELPLTVEQAMRLLVSGGVISPVAGVTVSQPVATPLAKPNPAA